MCCPPANQRCPDLPHGPGKGTTEGSLAWSKGQQRGSMPCQQPHLAEHTSLFLWEGGEWSSQQPPKPRLGQGCRRNWENCQMKNTNQPSALSQAGTMRKELFQNSSSVSKALFVKRTHPHMRLCVCSLDVVRNLVQLASVVIQDFITVIFWRVNPLFLKKNTKRPWSGNLKPSKSSLFLHGFSNLCPAWSSTAMSPRVLPASTISGSRRPKTWIRGQDMPRSRIQVETLRETAVIACNVIYEIIWCYMIYLSINK